MSAVQAIAAEMERYIRHQRCALQIEVADHLEEIYGDHAVYIDDETGQRRIRQSVRVEFGWRTRQSQHPIIWNPALTGWEVP